MKNNASQEPSDPNKIDPSVRAEWERFLDPQVLRPSLILTSVYIAAFEILKNAVVEDLRDFFITGWDQESGWIIAPEYKDEVLSKDKSATYASLKWLKEANAIDNDDIGKFGTAKKYRNLLAHEITKMLAQGIPPDFAERFNDMVALLDKIGRWWILNVEIPTDPDLASQAGEIDEDGIIPGRIMNLRMMIDVALGSDEVANYYITEFRKSMGSQAGPPSE